MLEINKWHTATRAKPATNVRLRTVGRRLQEFSVAKARGICRNNKVSKDVVNITKAAMSLAEGEQFDPATDSVSVNFGALFIAVPPNSFTKTKRSRYVYHDQEAGLHRMLNPGQGK